MKNTLCPTSGTPCTMATEIKEIHTAICGDEQMGHRGLAKRVDVVEKNQTKVVLGVLASSITVIGIFMKKFLGL